MRRLSFASILAMAIAAEASASPCYSPSEIEADQAIRLATELKVIGELCKDPSYAGFSKRNRDTLAAYEQILAEHLARETAASNVGSYVFSLEKAAMEHAAGSSSFCADALDLVTLSNGMLSDELRVYAAAKAEAARQDYPLCAAPAGPAPREAAPGRSPSPTTSIIVTASATPDLPRSSGPDDDGLLASLADTPLARMLDPSDRQRLKETTQQTLETAESGQTVGWRNPFSRNAGTVVAARPFKNARSQWCRRFEQSIVVSGEMRRSGGTACRRSDGSWEIEP